mmetsp:Transcript_24797/g.45305  ORF Transcript_24797/g.45305 Transcript_24797/m.45305 type:complete len:239 (+) Transcript_24797:4696-5412(+)
MGSPFCDFWLSSTTVCTRGGVGEGLHEPLYVGNALLHQKGDFREEVPQQFSPRQTVKFHLRVHEGLPQIAQQGQPHLRHECVVQQSSQQRVERVQTLQFRFHDVDVFVADGAGRQQIDQRHVVTQQRGQVPHRQLLFQRQHHRLGHSTWAPRQQTCRFIHRSRLAEERRNAAEGGRGCFRRRRHPRPLGRRRRLNRQRRRRRLNLALLLLLLLLLALCAPPLPFRSALAKCLALSPRF